MLSSGQTYQLLWTPLKGRFVLLLIKKNVVNVKKKKKRDLRRITFNSHSEITTEKGGQMIFVWKLQSCISMF